MHKSTWIPIVLIAGSGLVAAIQADVAKGRAESIAKSFTPFAPAVKTRSDSKHFFVESNGMPDHPLMVGITAWQQQVPLPQRYTDENAWQFPLVPVEASQKMSAKDHFFRGAIAIAADGVPIFNPIKNDGVTDTYLAGELDKFGGHSGRGDDYHYHIAPVFLQEKLGKSLPIAYALDGYPIYGYSDPGGDIPKNLDEYNGHETKALGYHYHATKSYPYVNGGFHGEVTELDGQVDPQPRAQSPRPATSPLRGAKITGFSKVKEGAYSLTYTIDGESRKVDYFVNADGSVRFDYVDGAGNVRSETYRGRNRGGGQEGRAASSGADRGETSGQLGPPPGPRKPWLVDHWKELDANQDGSVSADEVIAQCKSAFKEYAAGKESIQVEELPNLPTVRLAIGGFVKVHSKEIDGNSDSKITEQEIVDTMMRMFRKQDKNGDGKLTGSELIG